MKNHSNDPEEYLLCRYKDLADYLSRCDLKYREKVWKYLYDLAPKSRIVIEDICSETTIKDFIHAVCAYIWIYRDETIVFEENYSILRKL